MLWDFVEPYKTPRLGAAVTRAYDVFKKYEISQTITYCDCPVCMSAETAEKLSTLPLKQMSASLLAEYTNSAHGMDRDVIEREFKHLLPRYFEVIAECDPPSHLGLETCLRRLEGYRDHWPEEETAAVDEFFDAYVAASVNQLGLLEWPVGLRLAFDMGEVLGMVILAGGDLERVLTVFENSPDPQAAIHFASMREDVGVRRGVAYFENAHYEDHSDAADRLGAWLSRDVVTERIFAAYETMPDSDYEGVFNLGI